MLKERLKNHRVILASGSPRRHQFLKELEIPFAVEVKSIKEVYPDHLKGTEITDYLAQLKAKAFIDDLSNKDILITSDTIVSHKEQALGKPSTAKEAFDMISSLSNSTHKVVTSVCFTTSKEQKTVNNITEVTFKELTQEEINYYIMNYNPLDKAGAYGIQDWIGLIGITKIKGSYFNVVGLPTHLVYQTLWDLASS